MPQDKSSWGDVKVWVNQPAPPEVEKKFSTLARMSRVQMTPDPVPSEPTDLDRIDVMLAGARDGLEQVRRLMSVEHLPTDELRALANLYETAEQQLHALRGIANGQASREQSP